MEQKERLENLVYENELTKDLNKNISTEHLELHLADYYLRYANDATNEEERQKAMYYVSTYIFENKDKLDDGISIYRIINNRQNQYKKITKRDIYDGYVQMLVNNPSLFNLNFDYSLFEDMNEIEIEKLIAEYKKTMKLKWKILEDDQNFEIPEEVKDYIKGKIPRKKYIGTKRNPIEVFIEKKEFFDSSDPFLKVEGKDTFDGYVGYIYPNGKVVLDKFYDDADKKKVASEEAIYVMDLDDFYTLSHLSKSKIIANRLCKRFYHRGDWQERVKKEITGAADASIVQKTKILQTLK